MPDDNAISIQEYTVKYTLIIFVVIFIATMLHYLVYNHYLNEMQKNEYQNTLVQSANSVSRTLGFYQAVVDELASQPAVIDLLQFGSNKEVQQWANEMQRLLPESIGLALFDDKARVKGIDSELRLSEHCIADMSRRFNNQQISRPPIHYKIEALAHYDIVSPILVDGEKIGVVFASFSLDTIRHLLSGLHHEKQRLKITSPEGYQVATAGGGENQHENMQSFRQAIEHTDWEIELTVKNVEKNVLVTSLLISNIAVFVVISLTLYLAIKRLFNVVIADFGILSWLMQRIKAGTYESKDVSRVRLKEAQSVIRFIQFTAEELNQYQKKLKTESMTDELTGLYNRRALNEKIETYLEMANKKHQLFLVILDLDLFKKINDSFGHDVGDDVLKILAKVLKTVCKEDDMCTRAGGDEFIIVFVDYEPEDIQNWYKKLDELMDQSINAYSEEEKIDLEFGISAGCTLIRNNDMKSTVLKRADNALYKVKEKGGNHIGFL